METKTLIVNGMSCGHCVSSVEQAVKAAGGSAKVDLSNKMVEIIYDSSIVSIEYIQLAIEEQGYDIVNQ